MRSPLAVRPDGTQVCSWGEGSELYADYHDTEWGVPVTSEAGLFERMCLEGFQAGLSWITILKKRPAFRQAFAGFMPAVVARFGPADVQRLLHDPDIIRHRGKIEATISNAAAVENIRQSHGSLAEFFWTFAPAAPAAPAVPAAPTAPTATDDSFIVPSDTPGSHAMSKALKAAGWRYVGPTTCYALMQAVGIVNDHVPGCFRRSQLDTD